MNRAADEYGEASPGLGDDFLAVVEAAFDPIVAAPQRWPRVDARHHRYVLPRFLSASSIASVKPRSSWWPSLTSGGDLAIGLCVAEL
jgi:hypothetical protein